MANSTAKHDERPGAGLHPVVDLALAAAVLAAAALLFVGASSLPPPRFEPMGSAALPRILGGLLAVFAVIVGARAALRLLRSGEAPVTTDTPSDASNSSPVRTLVVLVALIAYVTALDVLAWPFVPVTAAFVLVLGATLASRRPRTLAIFAVYGTVLAFALHALFTRFLYVDL